MFFNYSSSFLRIDFTALPEGMFIFLKLLSHFNAISELQAIEGFEGTVNAAVSDGKNL